MDLEHQDLLPDIIEIYKKLCQLAQENLHKYNQRAVIYFEKPEGLSNSIFSYPVSHLLNIDDTDTFIRESFYKILDRPVDSMTLNKLTLLLRIKKLNRQELIQKIYNSDERSSKQTDLNYEQ